MVIEACSAIRGSCAARYLQHVHTNTHAIIAGDQRPWLLRQNKRAA